MMDIGQETFTFGGNNNDFLWANTLSNLVVAIRIAMAIWEVVGGVQKGGVLVRLQKDRLEGWQLIPCKSFPGVPPKSAI